MSFAREVCTYRQLKRRWILSSSEKMTDNLKEPPKKNLAQNRIPDPK